MLRLKTTKTRLYKLVAEYETLPPMRRTTFKKSIGWPDYRLGWADSKTDLQCDAFLTAVCGRPKLVITKKEFDGTEITRTVHTLDMKELEGRGMMEKFVPAAARRLAEMMNDDGS